MQRTNSMMRVEGPLRFFKDSDPHEKWSKIGEWAMVPRSTGKNEPRNKMFPTEFDETWPRGT